MKSKTTKTKKLIMATLISADTISSLASELEAIANTIRLHARANATDDICIIEGSVYAIVRSSSALRGTDIDCNDATASEETDDNFNASYRKIWEDLGIDEPTTYQTKSRYGCRVKPARQPKKPEMSQENWRDMWNRLGSYDDWEDIE